MKTLLFTSQTTLTIITFTVFKQDSVTESRCIVPASQSLRASAVRLRYSKSALHPDAIVLNAAAEL